MSKLIPRDALFHTLSLGACLFGFDALPVFAQELLVPNEAVWSWRKGTNEASSPITLWRQAGFEDSDWLTGNAPFWYGDVRSGGTQLTEMRYNYTCIFLRKTFVINDPTTVESLHLSAYVDDGLVAWINGVEVLRINIPAGEPTYQTLSANQIPDPAVVEDHTLPLPVTYLTAGTNCLAVQVFNHAANSSDLGFDCSLLATIPDASPPVVSTVVPAAHTTVGALTQITVNFNEPVIGVDAQDLLINGQPAASVMESAPTAFLFSFTQPLPGVVSVEWDSEPDISDLSGNRFDSVAPGANWNFTLKDTTSPNITERSPVAGATVSHLSQIELNFSEPVFGVRAADLLVNGQPATGVTGVEAGPYVFTFAQPASGAVNFSWDNSHGITDGATNTFAGSSWSLTIDPNQAIGDVIINEFVAGNLTGLADEDGERGDWIELCNRGATPVNLLGWSLTDDARLPGQWTFPAKVLNPGEYLVVFASGKDRRAPVGSNHFHTNFKLELFGDHLALFNAEFPRGIMSGFTPKFPEQRNDYSYGLDHADQWRYFVTPTPGAHNGSSSLLGVVPEPHFSVGRGLFDQPFELRLTTTQSGATIRYTLDGSEPTLSNGQTYSTPLFITNTAVIRATAFAADYLPSRTRTHSYLYLNSVLNQPNNPSGFPVSWGTRGSGNQYFPDNLVPADYAMDLDPVRTDPDNPGSAIDPEKLQRLKEGLRALPVVSLVMNTEDMFGPGSLHVNWTKTADVEKPCSVEMLLPDGTTAFATVCGIGMHGNASRQPEKNPKHGFKLSFRGDYGDSTLKYPLFPDSPAQEFDDLILRADFGTSWRHWSDLVNQNLGGLQRTRATRTRDAWYKNTFRDMGHVASHSRYCHLFINGLYWGTYDFTEQPTDSFAPSYFGGSKEDFDIWEQGALKSGTTTFFNQMTSISGLVDNSQYELMKQYLDMPQHIDYLLMHFFIGHEDWGGTKNWYAIRKRVSGPEGTFKYIPWDGENLLLNEGVDRDKNPGSYGYPSGLHTKLVDNAEYRLDFADRVFKHMIAPGGALTEPENVVRWNKWLAIMDKPIVAESCRWGDYRRDVHPYLNGTYQLYTRENHWLTESNRVVHSYLVNRAATVLNQFRRDGLYPSIDAPLFNQQGGRVAPGFQFTLSAAHGTIYFTTNGVDPRVYGSGAVSTAATTYSNALTLNSTVTVKARARSGNVWSAMNEATFTVGELGMPLCISEIMYNPPGDKACEFLEVLNVGATPLDLGLFSLQGVDYIFPAGTMIQPGATLLLGADADTNAFHVRYPGVAVSGFFGGSLANDGERLAILDRDGRTVTAVHYDDDDGWPEGADGGGASLEVIDPRGDPNAPANWRASLLVNGSPGLPPVTPSAPGMVVLNEIMADNLSSVTNGGLMPDWVEIYNRGTNTVSLAGWSLTDDSEPGEFLFPPGTTVGAGGFLVVWCDSATSAPGLHTGFSLSRNGETVLLYDDATNRIDAITFGLQIPDCSVGRVGEEWQLNSPTPGDNNIAATLAAATNLTINEWLANPVPGGQDWLELYNRSSTAPVALRGLYLTTSNDLFRLGALSFLPANGYVQLFADEKPGPNHLEFKLPASGGAIALADQTGRELESVVYGDQSEGVSEGRLPDGNTTINTFVESVSPGTSNYLLTWSGPILNELLARNDRAVIAPWGAYADYVELFNPSGSVVGLAGMGIGTVEGSDSAWKFPAGTSVPPGGFLVVWCDGSYPATSTASGPHNTGFSLSGSSGNIFLFNVNGQPVDRISYGFQLQDMSIGLHGDSWRLLAAPTPGAANSAIAVLGSANSLRLNEWMAAPLSGPDWFELYNSSALPVEMSGLYLTDNPSTVGITNSPIASLSFIGGHRWVKYIADDDIAEGNEHVGFSLDALGETLRLYTPNLSLLAVMDFGVQAEGVSEGCLPDGSSNIVSFPTTPTPATANYLPLTSIFINEVLSHTDPPLEDAVELFNPTPSPVNIGGWFLSDSQSDLKRYRIPDGTIIPGDGFKVFYQYQFGGTNTDDDAPPWFTFNSAHGDAVYLSQADASTNLTGYRIGQPFEASANGVSFGRHESSVGVHFVALEACTFGADDPATLSQFRTGLGASNAAPLVGPVVINQIMYHPPDFGTNSPAHEEFVQLLNRSGEVVPLFDPSHPTNVWRLAGGVRFSFATNQTVPAGARLRVVGFDPSNLTLLNAFTSRYGTNEPIVGPFSGSLDNAGDTIELWRPDFPQTTPIDFGFVPQLLVERVTYSDTAPWPTSADGGGYLLERTDPASYGNDPANWHAALPEGAIGPIDPPAITTSLPGGDLVRLTFNVESGRSYQVEYKDALTDSEWSPLGSSIGATGTTLTVDDSIAGHACRFYRVVRLP